MMAFTKKSMGKEIGPASVYAKPHTGAVAGVDLTNSGYPQTGMKTSGVKTRGNGAATKGVTARGPMA